MEPDPREEFLDDVMCQIEPMTDQEKADTLLGYLSLIIETMPDAELRAFRAHCLAKYPPGPEQDAVLEQVDGQLALLRFRQE